MALARPPFRERAVALMVQEPSELLRLPFDSVHMVILREIAVWRGDLRASLPAAGPKMVRPVKLVLHVDHFHDVYLAAVRPSPVLARRRHHPESWPITKLGLGCLDACLYATVEHIVFSLGR